MCPILSQAVPTGSFSLDTARARACSRGQKTLLLYPKQEHHRIIDPSPPSRANATIVITTATDSSDTSTVLYKVFTILKGL
jgi:hypothetical protein